MIAVVQPITVNVQLLAGPEWLFVIPVILLIVAAIATHGDTGRRR